MYEEVLYVGTLGDEVLCVYFLRCVTTAGSKVSFFSAGFF